MRFHFSSATMARLTSSVHGLTTELGLGQHMVNTGLAWATSTVSHPPTTTVYRLPWSPGPAVSAGLATPTL